MTYYKMMNGLAGRKSNGRGHYSGTGVVVCKAVTIPRRITFWAKSGLHQASRRLRQAYCHNQEDYG